MGVTSSGLSPPLVMSKFSNATMSASVACGNAGVRLCLEIIANELSVTMGLCGAMGSGDLMGYDRKGPIASAVPFEPLPLDKHGMSHTAPFAHEPRSRLQGNRRGLVRAPRLRFNTHAFQLPQDRFGEAAERPLLEFVVDAAHQEIAGEPHGW
jgi:hypothetical protein